MRHFALIGYPLKHSLSGELFNEQHFPDADYHIEELSSIERLRQWVEMKAIAGFNVTSPYKQAILPLLDALGSEAKAIGAVNCVVIENGKLIGHNTDAPAFQQSLGDLLNAKHLTPNVAFILGTGGAAHAVAYALRQLGIDYQFVSCHPERHPNAIGYSDLAAHLSPFSLIINTTPVGMYPDIDKAPLSLPSLSPITPLLIYDLIYNPSPTRLLREADALGVQTKDGLEMLRLQAQLSWRLWHLI